MTFGKEYADNIGSLDERKPVNHQIYGICLRDEQALMILGRTYETMTMEEVENLSRIDWKIRGWDLPPKSLTHIKRRLKKKIESRGTSDY